MVEVPHTRCQLFCLQWLAVALPTTTGTSAHHCLQELSKSFESTLEALVKKNNREIEKSESTFAQEMRQELRRKRQMQVPQHSTTTSQRSTTTS